MQKQKTPILRGVLMIDIEMNTDKTCWHQLPHHLCIQEFYKVEAISFFNQKLFMQSHSVDTFGVVGATCGRPHGQLC